MGWTLEFEFGPEVVTANDRERVRQTIWRDLDALPGVEIGPAPPEPGKLGPLSDALIVSVVGGAVGAVVAELMECVKGRFVRSAKIRTKSGQEYVLDRKTIKEVARIAEKLRLDD